MKFLPFQGRKTSTPAVEKLTTEVRHLVAVSSGRPEAVVEVLTGAAEADARAAVQALLADPESLFSSHYWNGAVAGLASPRLKAVVANGEIARLAAEAFVQVRRKGVHWSFEQASDALGSILVAAIRDAPEEELAAAVTALLTVVADVNSVGTREVGNLVLPPPPPPRFLVEAIGALQLRDSRRAWLVVQQLAQGPSSLAQVLGRLSSLRGDLTAVQAEAESALQLVQLAAELKGPAPSPAWLRRWEEIRAGGGPGLRAALLELTLHGEVAPEMTYGGSGTDIPKAAIFALASWDDAETRGLFRTAILNWARSGVGSPAVGSAAIWSLASYGDRDSIVTMLDIRRRIRHKNLLKRLDQEIERLSEKLGVTPDEIGDESVEDCGLDDAGARSWRLGDYVVTIQLLASGQVMREVRGPAGKAVKDVPVAIRKEAPEVWADVTGIGKLLKETIGAQRQRLESAMVDGRPWSLERWDIVFRGHPLLWNLARRLVWEAGGPAGRSLALPTANGWSGDGLDSVLPGSELRVAHTVIFTPAEQAYWQRRIVADRLVQPFKQVYRETYFVTPAEVADMDRSHRFSGHVIPNAVMYALARGRGWTGTMGLAGFDGSGQGAREFKSWKVRGRLEEDWAGNDDFSTISEVFFERSDDFGSWERMPIDQVPAIPFSETMRDIDLVVAVASIGTDQQWLEWEAQREAGAVNWNQQREAYASLAAAGSSVRGKMLEELLPVMKMAESARVDGHFVHVRGRLNEYRIHLGSGNIHMEPSGRYLCIVPVRSNEPRALYLPFEDPDLKSAEILSKIVMLTRDDLISDPAIKVQIADAKA